MWREYSKSFIKYNRAASASIMAAALIATMFLSLLCSLAYNFWTYDMEKIVLEEGDWQARITGDIDDGDLSVIQNFKNVERAVVNEDLSEPEQTVIDIYFQNIRTIYQDMPLISAKLGSGKDSIRYHSLLLSRYLIHDPEDSEPPMLLTLYLAILFIVMLSLILIIRNSFEISMNARIHQFGIFSSIGATPKQIRVCLLQETAVLSILPIIVGGLLGIMASRGLMGAVNMFAADVAGRHEAVFHYHPAIWGVTIGSSVLTVFFSAWIPAGKLSMMTPLEAIRGAGSLQMKKKRHSPILNRLFGLKGELAGNAIKAQKKTFRISSFSLLLSFLGFSVMLCFTTLADISTRYTYFERYQDAWDIMVTIKDTEIGEVHAIDDLQGMTGIREAALYQKAEAVAVLPEECQSDELCALGGFAAVAGTPKKEGQLSVKAPVVILDDSSFLRFCSQIGIEPRLDGAIVLNRIWDRLNSNFRYKKYVPFVKEEGGNSVEGWRAPLCNNSQKGQVIDIPVLAYTQTVPALREEYPDYGLVHFMPLRMWNGVSGQLGGAEADSYIRVFSAGSADAADLNRLEREIVRRIGSGYEIESENRVQERLANDRLIDGMKVILGGFCVLLAVIGIANVFSNTLGFLRQRKREFAQYMSIGLTPREMRDIFVIEALVVAGRPFLITIPFTVLFVQFAVTASYLDPMVFWSEAPIGAVLLFAAGIGLFVAAAYYIGGRRILRCELGEVLREDLAD